MAGAGMAANAATMPVDGDYEGTYQLGNAFSSHGLWLPDLLLNSDGSSAGFDNTWSFVLGSDTKAIYENGTLGLSGTVENTKGGVTYSLGFQFRLNEVTNHPGNLICGRDACRAASQEERDNIRFFDGDANGVIGTITGLGDLDGLVLDVTINKPNASDGNPKLGQLGFGGNWTTTNFGYSNWLKYDLRDQVADTSLAGLIGRSSGHGDINADLTLDGDPISSTPPVPLPAGLPLLVGGLGALAFMRRRRKAA
ncbi:MAG: VPLPA-CTERM sorting domain-containing protein [Pseudomonadota bacterium]